MPGVLCMTGPRCHCFRICCDWPPRGDWFGRGLYFNGPCVRVMPSTLPLYWKSARPILNKICTFKKHKTISIMSFSIHCNLMGWFIEYIKIVFQYEYITFIFKSNYLYIYSRQVAEKVRKKSIKSCFLKWKYKFQGQYNIIKNLQYGVKV